MQKKTKKQGWQYAALVTRIYRKYRHTCTIFNKKIPTNNHTYIWCIFVNVITWYTTIYMATTSTKWQV